MKAKDYANQIGISVDEWAGLMNTSTQNIHKLVKESSSEKGKFKFDNFLLSTTLRAKEITDYQELLKILEIHKLQKELSK
jgi:hypothetical protein